MGFTSNSSTVFLFTTLNCVGIYSHLASNCSKLRAPSPTGRPLSDKWLDHDISFFLSSPFLLPSIIFFFIPPLLHWHLFRSIASWLPCEFKLRRDIGKVFLPVRSCVGSFGTKRNHLRLNCSSGCATFVHNKEKCQSQRYTRACLAFFFSLHTNILEEEKRRQTDRYHEVALKWWPPCRKPTQRGRPLRQISRL